LFINGELILSTPFFFPFFNSIFVENMTEEKQNIKGRILKMLSYKYLLALLIFLAWIFFF